MLPEPGDAELLASIDTDWPEYPEFSAEVTAASQRAMPPALRAALEGAAEAAQALGEAVALVTTARDIGLGLVGEGRVRIVFRHGEYATGQVIGRDGVTYNVGWTADGLWCACPVGQIADCDPCDHLLGFACLLDIEGEGIG